MVVPGLEKVALVMTPAGQSRDWTVKRFFNFGENA